MTTISPSRSSVIDPDDTRDLVPGCGRSIVSASCSWLQFQAFPKSHISQSSLISHKEQDRTVFPTHVVQDTCSYCLMIALQLSTIALMMPTRRYLRSARIVSIVVRMHKSRDRPRPRQRLLARVRPDQVRYASGAPAVCQYHFTAWPHHGVPDAADLLGFIEKVKRDHAQERGPIALHCRLKCMACHACQNICTICLRLTIAFDVCV